MIEPTPGNIPRTCYFVKIKLVWLVFCLMRRCTCQFLVEVNKSTRSQPWIVLALNTIVKSEVNSLALWPSGTILTSSKTWISYHSLSFTLNAELPSGTAGQRQVVQHCRRDGAVPECRLHHHQQQDHWPRHTNLQHSQRVLLSTFTVISLICFSFVLNYTTRNWRTFTSSCKSTALSKSSGLYVYSILWHTRMENLCYLSTNGWSVWRFFLLFFLNVYYSTINCRTIDLVIQISSDLLSTGSALYGYCNLWHIDQGKEQLCYLFMNGWPQSSISRFSWMSARLP